MRKTTLAHGFTLVEILIAITIIGIIVALAVPALQNTKGKASQAQIDANLRSLNTLATQTRSTGVTNAGNTGNDKEAALAFYRSLGIFQPGQEPDTRHLKFENGVWSAEP